MSDTKLRDLERRWRETGTVEDEAAYLLERVRVGDVTRERLELAAQCGHAAARSTLVGNLPIVRDNPRKLAEALSEQFGRGAALRIVIALGEVLRGARQGGDEHVASALGVTRAALVKSSPNLDRLHGAWSDACGMDVLLRSAADHGAVLQLLLHRIERLDLKAQALQAIRDRISRWALDGTEP